MKQRLIGAVVLVVLAVVFLPMVFDGTSSTSEQAVNLTIPAAPGREFETRVLPLQPQSPAAAIGGDPTAPAAPIAEPDGIVTVDADDAKPRDAMEGTSMARVDAPIDTGAYQPSAAGAGNAASGLTPGAGTSGTAGSPTAPAPATGATVAPSATATTSPAATSTAPPTSARGRYVVSFGSYTRKANADALVAALRKGGVPAYADEVAVNGQAGLRVRAGPFVDRAAADETRLIAKRVRADVPGSIVEVDDSAAAAAAASAPNPSAAATVANASTATRAASPTGWAVQVAALKSEAEATTQRDKLRGAGFAAFVDPVRTEDGTLYRVRVGPEAVRAGAEKLRDALKRQFALDGMVVTHP